MFRRPFKNIEGNAALEDMNKDTNEYRYPVDSCISVTVSPTKKGYTLNVTGDDFNVQCNDNLKAAFAPLTLWEGLKDRLASVRQTFKRLWNGFMTCFKPSKDTLSSQATISTFEESQQGATAVPGTPPVGKDSPHNLTSTPSTPRLRRSHSEPSFFSKLANQTGRVTSYDDNMDLATHRL